MRVSPIVAAELPACHHGQGSRPACRPAARSSHWPAQVAHLHRDPARSAWGAPFRSTKCIRSHHRRTAAVVAAASAPAPVAEQLEDGDLAKWQSCVQKIVEQGVDDEEAETALAKAFGWKGQGYWRKSKVKEVPQPEQLDAVLSFLAEQGVQGDNVPTVLTKFPEVLALDVEKQLAANVETLQSTWFVRGLALKKLLRSQPQVLGYNVDCGGDCQGDCNRCWVRF